MCLSCLKPMSFYDFWGICPLFFFFWNAAISVISISNICTKKFLLTTLGNPAISKEGWPDGKESDCFPGQSGGRGETPEESKWGWTAQKANSWGQCQAQVMVQTLIKPYFSSLVHSQERFPGQQGRHFTNQQAIHFTAFVILF